MRSRLRAFWDWVSIYLPILLMGVLALATYWLVKNSPLLGVAEPESPLRHEVDYFMRSFSVKSFEAGGRLKSELQGTELRHFPDTDTLEVDRGRLRAFNDQGHLITAQADHVLSNGDASEVQLIGNAHVVREAVTDGSGQVQPRVELQGEFLHAFMNSERVVSHKPVVMLRGRDRFSADSMEFDNLDSVLQLRGRVRGVLPGTLPP